MGCVLSIDSDAHRTEELEYVRWGVDQARRAWVEPRHVLNTRPLDELLAWVAAKPVARVTPARRSGARRRTIRRDAHPTPRTRVTRPPRARRRRGRDGGAHAAVEPADAFLISGLLPVVMLLAGIGVLASAPGRRPFERLLVPAVLTGGAGAAIHLVPAGLPLVPFLLGVRAPPRPHPRARDAAAGPADGRDRDSDRARVLLAAVVTAFIAFTGVATLVPGGLAEPGGARRRRDP